MGWFKTTNWFWKLEDLDIPFFSPRRFFESFSDFAAYQVRRFKTEPGQNHHAGWIRVLETNGFWGENLVGFQVEGWPLGWRPGPQKIPNLPLCKPPTFEVNLTWSKRFVSVNLRLEWINQYNFWVLPKHWFTMDILSPPLPGVAVTNRSRENDFRTNVRSLKV